MKPRPPRKHVTLPTLQQRFNVLARYETSSSCANKLPSLRYNNVVLGGADYALAQRYADYA